MVFPPVPLRSRAMPTLQYEHVFESQPQHQQPPPRKGETADTSEMAWIVNEFTRIHQGITTTPKTTTNPNDTTLSEGSFVESAFWNSATATAVDVPTQSSSNPLPPSIGRGFVDPRDQEKSNCDSINEQQQEEDSEETCCEESMVLLSQCYLSQRKDHNDNYDDPNNSSSSPQQHHQNNDADDDDFDASAERGLTTSSSQTNQRRRIRRNSKGERRKGPNESYYISNYHATVQKALADYNARNPGQLLPDYRRMENDDDKVQAQQRVSDLLTRLRITEQRGEDINFQRTVGNSSSPCETSKSIGGKSEVLFSPDDSSPMPRNEAINSDNGGDEGEKFVRLFSPDADSSSSSPIENNRSCRRGFQSPDINIVCDEEIHQPCKRLASQSGKRGADHRRARLSWEDHSTTAAAAVARALENSMRHLSISPVPKFPTSQSPIFPGDISPRHHHPSSPNDSVSLSDVVSMGDDDEKEEEKRTVAPPTTEQRKDQSRQDSVGISFGTTASETNAGRPFHHLIHYIGLKKQAACYYQPLTMASRLTSMVKNKASYPDPLKHYPKPTWSILQAIVKRVHRLSRTKPQSSVVFSLLNDQIIHVSLKLLMTDTDTTKEVSPIDKKPTLIVVREKAWVKVYVQALREGSWLSVVDHSTIPLKERKSPSTTERLRKFDIVVTTFDALKSHDIALHRQDNGIGVQIPNASSQGNWHSSRKNHPINNNNNIDDDNSNNSTASQAADSVASSLVPCSILHLIYWNRVVMVDQIGRKSFVIKPNTSRFMACQYLNANSRLIFFFPDECGGHKKEFGFDQLLHSNENQKRIICSTLASLLRLQESQSNETTLREITVDAKDI